MSLTILNYGWSGKRSYKIAFTRGCLFAWWEKAISSVYCLIKININLLPFHDFTYVEVIFFHINVESKTNTKMINRRVGNCAAHCFPQEFKKGFNTYQSGPKWLAIVLVIRSLHKAYFKGKYVCLKVWKYCNEYKTGFLCPSITTGTAQLCMLSWVCVISWGRIYSLSGRHTLGIERKGVLFTRV